MTLTDHYSKMIIIPCIIDFSLTEFATDIAGAV